MPMEGTRVHCPSPLNRQPWYGTLHAVVFHDPIAKRSAAVAAGIAEAMGLTVLVAPQHEVLTQHALL